ncbi:MAG: hypothetical protein AAFY07_11555 [Pseudomonadota bacterium]
MKMRISFLFAALLLGQSCDLVAGRIEIDGGPGYEVHEIFDEVGAASLASAACEGDIAELERMVASGAEVDKPGRFEVTALTWALTCDGLHFNPYRDRAGYSYSSKGQLQDKRDSTEFSASIRLLLASGADPNHKIEGDYGPIEPYSHEYYIDGYSPLLIAAEFHDSEILSLLLEFGGNPNAIDTTNDVSALTAAFDRGYWLDGNPGGLASDPRAWDNLYVLLGAGADLTSSPDGYLNVVELAALRRNDILQHLLENYEYSGDIDMIVSFLEAHIEVGYPDQERKKEILRFLAENKGAQVDPSLLADPAQ